MQRYTDYFVGVYYSGDVIKLSRVGDIPNSDIRFIIHCGFERLSTTGKTAYYLNHLYDSKNELIKENRFNWSGIECKIHEEEKWEIVTPPNSFGVSLSADVYDKLGIMKTVKFNNHLHDGKAFQLLFDYLQKLSEYESHKAFSVIKSKENIIQKLRSDLVKLKEG